MACEFCSTDVTKALVGTNLVHESEYHEAIKDTFAFQRWELGREVQWRMAPVTELLTRAFSQLGKVVKWFFR